MDVPIPSHRRHQEYWDWVAVALFLLLSVDLLTTVFAVKVAGVAGEANPIVAWAFERGMGWLLGINLLALLVLVALFHGLITLARRSPEPLDDVVALSFEVWIGGLIAAGLFVFANNLVVILEGRDLVSLVAQLLP